MARLTGRMKNWLEGVGAHVGLATAQAVPVVVVVDRAEVEGEQVSFPLSPAQHAQIAPILAENPQVAFGPGGLGCIRAAYQFKGKGRLEEGPRLVVEVDEIYCTKPGPEAGLRLDTLPYEVMIKFEQSRWNDNGPPR